MFALALSFASSPCAAAETTSEAGEAYFEKHIRPLFAKHCYSCHSLKRQEREGGLILDRREGLHAGGDSGAAIVPGDVEASRLIRAVRYEDPDLQMPLESRLSPDDVKRLEHWVRIGAPWPDETDSASEAQWHDPADPVAGRSHWAFQPIQPYEPDELETLGQQASPIDTFVRKRLAEQQLKPAPMAKRRALLRRTSFQLTGLPPDPHDVSEFLADARPGAFERQVDRLLASSHFGERWGRHWLDLARYADSNGLDENFLFREAWRYRNRVIQVIGADMPFDRFLEEQIAGDLLPFDSIHQRDQQRVSAGFLVVGPKVLLGNNAQERVMDVADEQLDTIGRAVLGQTLGCARCHDHKFDPFPTEDYYALAGIMTSTSVMQQRYMLGQQRNMERLVGLGSEGDKVNNEYETYWRELGSLKERHKRAKTALELLTGDKETELAELAKEHPKAVANASLDQSHSAEQRRQSQRELIQRIETAVAKPPSIPPRAMIPTDVDQPSNEAVRLAGQFDRKGDVVSRGFLQVLDGKRITIPDDQSGRLELARWLTDTECGAGHLAARVLANRIWHHLIGRGIVRTVDNFGRTGEPPSHPQLLDYLAGRLIDSGWSVKSLVREIVLSETFQQSSRFDEDGYAVDPENRLLWRAHRRRLDPESLRDAMLHAADQLDRAMLDSTVSYLGDQATAVGANKNRRRTDYANRSVYLPVIRNDLPELFQAFDFADPHSATGMRPDTIGPSQGLFLMNDDSVMKTAEATARRILSLASADPQRVAVMYQLILNAEVDSVERKELLGFVNRMEEEAVAAGHDDAQTRAWTTACHALFASSRFQMLE